VGDVVPFRRRQYGPGVADRPALSAAEHVPARRGSAISAGTLNTGALNARPLNDRPLDARPPNDRPRREPLWREVTGAVLKQERHRQRKTLAQVAGRAGMSVQYLSELERGRKEASSEMLAAACGSLGLSLAEFLQRTTAVIASPVARPGDPVLLAA
jgi:hypothetical protein